MIIIYGHLQEMQEIEKLILIHLNSEVGPVDVQYFGHKLFSSLPGKTFFLCRDYGKHEKKIKVQCVTCVVFLTFINSYADSCSAVRTSAKSAFLN